MSDCVSPRDVKLRLDAERVIALGWDEGVVGESPSPQDTRARQRATAIVRRALLVRDRGPVGRLFISVGLRKYKNLVFGVASNIVRFFTISTPWHSQIKYHAQNDKVNG